MKALTKRDVATLLRLLDEVASTNGCPPRDGCSTCNRGRSAAKLIFKITGKKRLDS